MLRMVLLAGSILFGLLENVAAEVTRVILPATAD